MKKILFIIYFLYFGWYQGKGQGIPQLQTGVFVYDTLGTFAFTFSGLCSTPEYTLCMGNDIIPFATGVNLHIICISYTAPAGTIWTDEAGTLSLYDSLFFSNLTPCFNFHASAAGTATFVFMMKGTPTMPNEPYPCYFAAVYTPGPCNNDLTYSGDTATCYVMGPTGLSEKEEKPALRIFPIPFSYEATIAMSGQHTIGDLQMILSDVLGRKVRNILLAGSHSKFVRGNLSNGIYFYSIVADEKTLYTGKIVVE